MIAKTGPYLAAALLGAAACTGVDRIQFVARIITAGEEDALVTVPETVAVGERFEVTVLTFHGCREEPGFVDIAVTGLRATVTPFDFRISSPNCPGFETEVLRRAQLMFTQAGSATVVFVGTGLDGGLLEFVRTLTVQ